jgi:putative salt-induced outer membrane protein YdiY
VKLGLLRLSAPALSFLILVSAALGDTITTTNGERFVGRIIQDSPDAVVFESAIAGRITIPRSAIREVQSSLAQPQKGQTNAVAATNTQPPLPFLPRDTYDWVKLKSGEWLKGKIKSLQDEKLEFDSEELDVHTWDWKDIRALRSPRLSSVRFENKETADGSFFITTNEVFLMTNAGTNVYARSNLLAITPTGASEISKWSADLSIGMAFRSGNTKEVDYTARALLRRRTPSTRLTFDYLGNYGSVNDTKTEDNQRLATTFDLFLSRRLFLRLPDAEYYRDPLQNLDARLTIGGSVGYDFIHTPRTEWDVTIGPGFQRNWYGSVEPGESRTAGSAAAVISSRFDMEITKRLDLILEYRGQFTGKETGDNTHHAVATLEFEIHKRLDLDISFVWDRISSPQTESSGTTPSTDDLRLTLGLGVKF